MTHTLSPKTHSRRSGFALVIALSLMAFVLLLILSITTFVQVESANAAISKDQLEARMNAQLGGMIALGNLQKFAGVDQRVTARPDILLAPSTAPLVGQGQWTGVWSSKQDLDDTLDAAVNLDNHGVQWLVSGDSPDATVAVDLNDSVVLAAVEHSVQRPEQTVRAPLVDIESNTGATSGQYAYWVSDDGVKARINLPDIYNDDTLDDADYYRFALAQQVDATTSRTSDDLQPFLPVTNESIWKDPDTRVASVVSNAALQLLNVDGVTDTVKREFFHDFSTNSSSVLTNLKEGGLKQDLSLALLSPPANGLTGPIFTPANESNPGVGDPGGPTWEQMGDYYKYSLNNNTGSIAFKPGSTDEFGITPVVTRFQFIVHVFANRVRTLEPPDAAWGIPEWANRSLAEDYVYLVGMFPLVTLWNPYDHDLVIPDLGMETDMTGIALIRNTKTGESYPPPFKIANSDFNIFTILDNGDIQPGSDPYDRRKVGFTIQGVTIPAGEAINFSPPHNSYIDFGDAKKNWLVPGAADKLITGFFTVPVGPINDPGPGNRHEFNTHLPADLNGYERAIYEDNLLKFAATTARAHQEANFYIEPFSGTPDSKDRFFSLATEGMYSHFRKIDNDPRVIRIWDAAGKAHFNFIENSGSTVGASYDEGLSLVDLQKIENISKIVNGVARYFPFPEAVTGNESVQLLSQFNPRAPINVDQIHHEIQRNKPIADKYLYRMLAEEPYTFWNSAGDNNRTSYFTVGVSDEVGYVGMSNDGITGNEKMVLFEAPTRTPLGIGQFTHANLNNIGTIGWTIPGMSWRSNLQMAHTAPAYAIGNSIANIHLPLNLTKAVVEPTSPMFEGSSPASSFPNSYSGSLYDYSYELNDALWDNFYMSTLIPESGSGSISFPSEDFLPNSRIKLRDSTAPETDLLDSRRQAAYLMLEGGFNVNSTSVAAWEAVLGALRDVDTLGADTASLELVHSYSRFIEPLVESTAEIPSYGVSDPIVAGYRSLSDKQISALATALVREIRIRRSAKGHPFLSLAEFINRSIDSTDIADSSRRRFAYTGPLQFAIEQSEINGTPAVDENWNSQLGDANGLWDTGYISSQLPSDSPFLSEPLEVIKSRPFLDAAPGALTQADVLSKIGHELTARSDTFTIRSYGSVKSPLTGKDTATTCFELVVQRVPDYLDSSDENFDAASVPENLKFGRKFEILSARWIPASQI